MRPRHRAGGEDHVLAADGRRYRRGPRHGDGAIGSERADAVEDGDLLRLHEAGEALDEPSTILCLRACAVAKLTIGALDSMPNSPAWAT